MLTCLSRLKIWNELEALKINTSLGKDMCLEEADFQRVALTVAYATVNPSKKWYLQLNLISNLFPVQVDWDIERYMDKIMTITMGRNYESRIKNELARLKNLFQMPDSSEHIDEPATIVDKFGRILLWHLPDIISELRIVREPVDPFL